MLRAVRSGSGSADWFMDYRNADGSVAEMCGNGIRVFARYLLRAGLAEGPELVIGTRAGERRAWPEPGGEITVDMGPVRMLGPGTAIVGGRQCGGVAVWVGNPHLACLTETPLGEFDLSAPPVTDAAQFPHGVNVELVRVTGERVAEMRVFERGSGETMSCGTGAVAAALAAATAGGPVAAVPVAAEPPGSAERDGSGATGPRWVVQVPGGSLTVTLTATTALLTGAAEIVAEGELSEAWLRAGTARSRPSRPPAGARPRPAPSRPGS